MDSNINFLKRRASYQLERWHYEILGFELIQSKYGAGKNSFIVHSQNQLGPKKFLLKITMKEKIKNEVLGSNLLSKIIPVPDILAFEFKDEFGFLVREYQDGPLLVELIHNLEKENDISQIIRIESFKEKTLSNTYSQPYKMIDFEEYTRLASSNLFIHRLNGAQYKLFYGEDAQLSRISNKKVKINNTSYDYTFNDIFRKIRERFNTNSQKLCRVYPSHGDAHHCNILYTSANQHSFIDCEYSGYLPPLMDLAKPYYNDFLGALFHLYPSYLDKYLELISIKESDNTLEIKIKLKEMMLARLELTKVKIKYRKKFIAHDSDYISLSDYLFLCHTLTRNPDDFDERTFWYFIVFGYVLFNFDPYHPDSIKKFFA